MGKGQGCQFDGLMEPQESPIPLLCALELGEVKPHGPRGGLDTSPTSWQAKEAFSGIRTHLFATEHNPPQNAM